MGTVHAKEPLGGRETEKEWKPLKEVPARVDKVHFEGIHRTKDDILMQVVSDLFEAQNFHEVVLKAHSIRQQLESLRAFNSIEIILDTSQGPGATPEGLEVTFDIKEKSQAEANINLVAGNNDGSIISRVILPNIFGRGETVYAEYQHGRKTVGFNVLSTKPLLGWAKPRINQTIFGYTTDFPYSGFKEKVKGLAAEVQFESSPQVQHTLRWEGSWRNVCGLLHTTPFSIREEAGHSVKSCLKHVLTMDQRDNPCLPNRGSYFNLYQEYAGLGGNVSFLKHEIQYQVNKSIWGDLVLQGTLMGGLVRTLGTDSALRINDRFFLGGPLTFRGFAMNGVGPHTEHSALGAEAYWAGGLHVYAPLPFKPLKNILDKVCRAHVFVNAGNIGNFAFTDDYHQNFTVALSRLRWSCGAGLVLAVGGIARFELNYCFPISNEAGDRVNRGLQFGVGLNYL